MILISNFILAFSFKFLNNIKINNINRLNEERYLSKGNFYNFSFDKLIFEKNICKCSYEENFQCSQSSYFSEKTFNEKRKKRDIQIKNNDFKMDNFFYIDFKEV